MPILSTGDLHLKTGILSFPAVIEPKSFEGGTPRYSASLILTSSDKEWQEFMAVVKMKMKEKFADKADGVMKNIMSDKRLRCFGNGSEKTDALGEIYAGYDGPDAVYVSASSASKPQLFAANAHPVAPENANELFVGGNFVSAIIRPWIQDNKYGKAIRSELIGLQYLREGEHFGAPTIDGGNVFEAQPGSEDAVSDAFSMLD